MACPTARPLPTPFLSWRDSRANTRSWSLCSRVPAITLGAAVDILLKDGVLLLHNGKSEIGPRALGNRSFITRPDKLDVKERVSEHIKQREFYRPLAPVVLEERTTEYFRGPERSPFMLYRYDVLEPKIDCIIGGVHAGKSARVQTIARTINPFLYDLTRAYGERTGTYVLLNTSLNLKGEPLSNIWQDSLGIYKRVEGTQVQIDFTHHTYVQRWHFFDSTLSVLAI
jgi:carbamoyltransferase